MPFLNDPNFIRELIMDHYQNPINKVEVAPEGYEAIHMDSDSCTDDFYIYLLMDGNTVKDVKFSGIGCTISTASISMMCEMIPGKTKEEALDLITNYKNMAEHHDEYDEDKLEELNAFANIYKQANRIKCATIGFNGLEQLLKKEEK